MSADREENNKNLIEVMESFQKDSEAELNARWQAWGKNSSKNEVYEVVGALLARQVSLAVNFAQAPHIWNGHIAPLIHRAMADVYISLAWILEDPEIRSQRFIYYGLGQAKLMIEHRKKQAERDGKKAEDDPVIGGYENWINSQRYTFLTEVDLGSWSDKSVRKMAEEAGCIDFYNYVYAPFSAAVHSMWNHVSIYNLKVCENPLHRYHKVPCYSLHCELAVEDLYLVAKYLNKTFRKFDEKTGVVVEVPSSFKNLRDAITEKNKQSPACESP